MPAKPNANWAWSLGSTSQSMWYRFIPRRDELKIDLFNRQTAEETKEFLGAVVAHVRKHWRSLILIHVHSSRPVFKVDDYGFLDHLEELAVKLSCKIALLGDTEELWLSHQYIELLAKQRGINLRCFWDEFSALHWLRSASGLDHDIQVAS